MIKDTINDDEEKGIRITSKGIKTVKLLETSKLFRAFWYLDGFLYDTCKPLYKLSNALMDFIWFGEFDERGRLKR